jgi:hypothetical protein
MDDQLKSASLSVATEAATEFSAGTNPFYSKTFWAGLLMAIVPIAFPPAAALIAANPALYAGASGAIVVGLRHLTAGGFRWPWN